MLVLVVIMNVIIIKMYTIPRVTSFESVKVTRCQHKCVSSIYALSHKTFHAPPPPPPPHPQNKELSRVDSFFRIGMYVHCHVVFSKNIRRYTSMLGVIQVWTH